MARATDSLGTPARGVGAGNVVVVVDETTDIDCVQGSVKLRWTSATICADRTSRSTMLWDGAFDKES